MPTIYRVTHPGCDEITDIGSVEAIDRVIRSEEPGRYHVDQIGTEPLLSGHTSRSWGRMIRHPDGRVEGSGLSVPSQRSPLPISEKANAPRSRAASPQQPHWPRA
jgi:hypothetical protein